MAVKDYLISQTLINMVPDLNVLDINGGMYEP
jgi:hypothetical protein